MARESNFVSKVEAITLEETRDWRVKLDQTQELDDILQEVREGVENQAKE